MGLAAGIDTPAVAALATPTSAIENSALATRPRDFNDPPRSGPGIPHKRTPSSARFNHLAGILPVLYGYCPRRRDQTQAPGPYPSPAKSPAVIMQRLVLTG